MRILWVKTELLHPVDKGGKIRTYQMLKSLIRHHEVVYLALDDGSAAPDALARAKEYATSVVTVPFKPAAKGTIRYFLDLFLNLFSGLPYAVARYRSSLLREKIASLAGGVDLVICDFLAPAVNVPATLPVRAVLFQHNVEAMIWERHASVPQHPVRRLYMREQWRRMQKFEGAACRRFDHVVAVSADDAAIFRERFAVKDVSAVATGVDLAFFEPRADVARAPAGIIFVGSMDWMPNTDGILWFAESAYRAIRARVPAAALHIVGRSPPAAVRELAERLPNVHVTGTVPDVRPYLAGAAVSVVPLRVGGGTRLKIFEAMAIGTPVVSTTIGAEGLPVRHGEHLLIADDPAEFAQAVVRLLEDRALAARIAANALQFVREHCGWDAVTDRFVSQCVAEPARAATSSQGSPA